MGRRVQQRVDLALDDAERRGRCACPAHQEVRAFQRRVGAGGLVSPHPGLFVHAGYWNSLRPPERAVHLMQALSIKHPGWVFSDAAACVLHGLDVPYELLHPLQAHTASCSSPKQRGLVMVRAGYHGPSIQLKGVRVAPFRRCVADCLLRATFQLGLAIADAAMRLMCCPHTSDLLLSLEREIAGRPGARRARIIAFHADARAENGGESRARAVMIEAGFPPPELQVEFEDPVEPGRRYRVDQFWRLEDGSGRIGELDGKVKYVDPTMAPFGPVEALLAERRRESRLTLCGYPVIRYTMDDVRVPARLVRILEAAGIPRDHEAARAWRERWLAAAPPSLRKDGRGA